MFEVIISILQNQSGMAMLGGIFSMLSIIMVYVFKISAKIATFQLEFTNLKIDVERLTDKIEKNYLTKEMADKTFEIQSLRISVIETSVNELKKK